MEEPVMLSNTILLFDSYSADGRRLYESFRLAGCDCSVVVLENNDFLPEEAMSAYDLFLGYYGERGRALGKPKFFNEVAVPDHWSINAGVGESDYGRITYQHEEKGRIYYWDSPKKYRVRAVDWFDRKGAVRFRDHYNRYGAVCARTVYDGQGKELGKTWFSAGGQEAITKNCVTGDLIVNDGKLVKFFRNEMDMIVYFFRRAGFEQRRVFYNSLANPFLISGRLPVTEKKDILFWQENVEGEIPGNMQKILSGQAARTDRIMVQKRAVYDRLLELGATPDKIQRLGYVYDFKKKNEHRTQALICTNSERIEHCEELIRAFPQMHFHIAAVTLMSPKLMDMGRFDNVTLYPGAQADTFDQLFMSCDYYFDINHWTEIVSAVYQAFLHHQVIFAFEETAHNREYVANAHIYPIAEFDRLVSDVREIMESSEAMERHLEMQLTDAMAEKKETYRSLIE
ncbi:MAG: accessory Sec system glycosylation chaperone GtfB [Ruminococcus flavefaciens]|nr:accessory Sec system glycosylation chaperone GtfB [Ruminococcus flavefaciens]